VITLGIISLLLGLAWPVFQPWNERVQLQMELATIRGFAEEAQWLALSTRRRHRLVENADFVALQRSGDSGYETLDSQQLSPEIEVTATRWPSFSAFGFAQGGTITLRSGTHEGKIVVNPIGRIRTTGPNTAR
jgi:Tfp pilus assembly protein FimT